MHGVMCSSAWCIIIIEHRAKCISGNSWHCLENKNGRSPFRFFFLHLVGSRRRSPCSRPRPRRRAVFSAALAADCLWRSARCVILIVFVPWRSVLDPLTRTWRWSIEEIFFRSVLEIFLEYAGSIEWLGMIAFDSLSESRNEVSLVYSVVRGIVEILFPLV